MKPFLHELNKKASRGTRPLSKINCFVSRNTSHLWLLYYLLIYPCLIYGLLVWTKTCNSSKVEIYLTVILRGRAGYELIYITNEAVGRVGYYHLISGKSEKNNCFSKFSSNSLDFFGWNLLKSWHFLYRRRRQNIFSDLQNFSTRNSLSVFPYLVKLNDNGSYHGLREPIRKLENYYPELKIY